MELGKTFDIELNGIYRQATLIDIIEYQQDKYAIYTIMNDNNACDIYTSRVKIEANGQIQFIGAASEGVRKYLLNLINKK
jgi:hypothetical protein